MEETKSNLNRELLTLFSVGREGGKGTSFVFVTLGCRDRSEFWLKSGDNEDVVSWKEKLACFSWNYKSTISITLLVCPSGTISVGGFY